MRRRQFTMWFAGKSRRNILPKAPSILHSLWAIFPDQAKGDPGYDHAFRWPHGIIICSYRTRGFARWPPRRDVPWGQPSSLWGTGRSLPSAPSSLGSALCRPIARETPEMLQMIQQDAFVSIIPSLWSDRTAWGMYRAMEGFSRILKQIQKRDKSDTS